MKKLLRLFFGPPVLPAPCPTTIPRPWAHRFYVQHWTKAWADMVRNPPPRDSAPYKGMTLHIRRTYAYSFPKLRRVS